VCKSGEKEAVEEKASKEEKGEVEILSVEQLIPIFGESTGTESGIVDVYQDQEELLISYNLYVVDEDGIDEEIGLDLAPKIRKFYEKFKTYDSVAFKVFVPDSGEEGWKPYVYFVMNRKLVEQTNWTDLLETDFLKVVKELKYYE
jgi:hypothetical protein